MGFIIYFGVTLELVLFRYTGIVLRSISVMLESELNLVLHQRSAQWISASLFRMHHQVTPTPFRDILRCCAGAHCTSTAQFRITSIPVFTSQHCCAALQGTPCNSAAACVRNSHQSPLCKQPFISTVPKLPRYQEIVLSQFHFCFLWYSAMRC